MSDQPEPQHGPPTPRTHPMGDDGRPVPPDANAPTRISESGAGAGSAQTRMATTRRNVPTGELPRRWGDFELIRELGRGGMGVVYEARQVGLGRTVAVKIMLAADAELRARFEREARALALVDSPHVVRVYHAGSYGEELFFAMEFVRGQDLAQRIKAGWRPTHAQALDLVRQAAVGLAAAAAHGLIHRDIKPGNMMLAEDGTLKLMDFGLVRIADDAVPLTTSGLVMGTVHYFSPEQGMGQRCDHRSDLYSLGVVFFELLTGRRPFSGESAAALIYQHIHADPPMPRLLDETIPIGYQDVVLRCMSKRPEQRYNDAAALIAALDGLRTRREPTPRRRALGFASLVAAVVVAAALIGVTTWRLRVARPTRAPTAAAAAPVSDPAAHLRDPTQTPDARSSDAPRPDAHSADAQAPDAHALAADAHARDAAATIVAAADPRAHPENADPTPPPRAPDPSPTDHEHPLADAADPTAHVDALPTVDAATVRAHDAQPLPAITPATPTSPAVPTSPQAPETTSAPETRSATPATPVASPPVVADATTPTATAPVDATPTAKPAPPAAAEPPRAPGFGAPAHDERGAYADLAVAGLAARFRWCRAGEFVMGAAGIKDAPPHRVRLTRGFWLAEVETTQALWRAVAGEHPSKDRGDDLPVANCSRDDCERFLAKLRERVPGLRARLPTEAEWEYACRAGGALAGDARVAGHYDGQAKPHAPRGYAANAWGFCDMIGNVAEWVADDFAAYPAGEAVDPRAVHGAKGVARGGYWEDAPDACRPASRDQLYLDGYRARSAGMRIAVDAP